MDDKLIQVIEKLGAAGIDAFYVYMILEYGTLWLFFGLCTIAVRAMWKRLKEKEDA